MTASNSKISAADYRLQKDKNYERFQSLEKEAVAAADTPEYGKKLQACLQYYVNYRQEFPIFPQDYLKKRIPELISLLTHFYIEHFQSPNNKDAKAKISILTSEIDSFIGLIVSKWDPCDYEIEKIKVLIMRFSEYLLQRAKDERINLDKFFHLFKFCYRYRFFLDHQWAPNSLIHQGLDYALFPTQKLIKSNHMDLVHIWWDNDSLNSLIVECCLRQPSLTTSSVVVDLLNTGMYWNEQLLDRLALEIFKKEKYSFNNVGEKLFQRLLPRFVSLHCEQFNFNPALAFIFRTFKDHPYDKKALPKMSELLNKIIAHFNNKKDEDIELLGKFLALNFQAFKYEKQDEIKPLIVRLAEHVFKSQKPFIYNDPNTFATLEDSIAKEHVNHFEYKTAIQFLYNHFTNNFFSEFSQSAVFELIGRVAEHLLSEKNNDVVLVLEQLRAFYPEPEKEGSVQLHQAIINKITERVKLPTLKPHLLWTNISPDDSLVQYSSATKQLSLQGVNYYFVGSMNDSAEKYESKDHKAIRVKTYRASTPNVMWSAANSAIVSREVNNGIGGFGICSNDMNTAVVVSPYDNGSQLTPFYATLRGNSIDIMALEILISGLKAIQTFHNKGFVLGNITPNNFVFVPAENDLKESEVKALDLESARQFGTKPAPFPANLAPELKDPTTVAGASQDIYLCMDLLFPYGLTNPFLRSLVDYAKFVTRLKEPHLRPSIDHLINVFEKAILILRTPSTDSEINKWRMYELIPLLFSHREGRISIYLDLLELHVKITHLSNPNYLPYIRNWQSHVDINQSSVAPLATILQVYGISIKEIINLISEYWSFSNDNAENYNREARFQKSLKTLANNPSVQNSSRMRMVAYEKKRNVFSAYEEVEFDRMMANYYSETRNGAPSLVSPTERLSEMISYCYNWMGLLTMTKNVLPSIRGSLFRSKVALHLINLLHEQSVTNPKEIEMLADIIFNQLSRTSEVDFNDRKKTADRFDSKVSSIVNDELSKNLLRGQSGVKPNYKIAVSRNHISAASASDAPDSKKDNDFIDRFAVNFSLLSVKAKNYFMDYTANRCFNKKNFDFSLKFLNHALANENIKTLTPSLIKLVKKVSEQILSTTGEKSFDYKHPKLYRAYCSHVRYKTKDDLCLFATKEVKPTLEKAASLGNLKKLSL